MATREKACARCGRCFPATRAFFYIQRRGKYGLRSRCKDCERKRVRADSQRIKEVQQRWYLANRPRQLLVRHEYYRRNRKKMLRQNHLRYQAKREQILAYHRRWDLQKQFGITPEEYDAMLVRQNGVCALCGLSPSGKRLAVDHDHGNGLVRGLVHTFCNAVLGWVDRYGIERVEGYLSQANR